MENQRTTRYKNINEIHKARNRTIYERWQQSPEPKTLLVVALAAEFYLTEGRIYQIVRKEKAHAAKHS